MKLEELKGVESLIVFQGDRPAATLTRTEHGSQFAYRDDFLTTLSPTDRGIATTLPPSKTPLSVVGDNVPPFFAGLLPEGARLSALIKILKTSASDMFTMLAATGDDCVGDISVSPVRESPLSPDTSQIHDPTAFSEVSFEELFERSISAEDISWRRYDPGFPGMFPKLSSQVFSFPVRLRRSRYIVKLGVPEYPHLVRNEHFFMKMAAGCKIIAANTAIVTDKNNREGLLVSRFDRRYDPLGKRFEKFHQEDACQFLNRYPHDKYRLSLRSIMEKIEHHASAPRIELLRLLEVIAFSYIIGNGDHHAKNISLLWHDNRVALSPAYDLLSTLPYGDNHMALKLDGRDAHLKRAHFIEFGGRFGLSPKALTVMLDRLIGRAAKWIPRITEIGFEPKIERFLMQEMKKRMDLLSGEN
jgi:serine/threonine-protein kinase HipA